MGNELTKEVCDQIKIEANEIYWQTHKASIGRDPYTRGLTMFEVAQVPLIEALTEKEFRYQELKDRAQCMVDALEKIKKQCEDGGAKHVAIDDPKGMAIYHSLHLAHQALQQFKDGGKEGENGS